MRLGLCLALLVTFGCTRPNDSYGPASVVADEPDLGAPDDLAMDQGHKPRPDLQPRVDLAGAGDLGHVKNFCPPPGATPSMPPALGNLASQKCDYDCWGKGTIYNVCGPDQYQFCMHSGEFAPCQYIMN